MRARLRESEPEERERFEGKGWGGTRGKGGNEEKEGFRRREEAVKCKRGRMGSWMVE